MLLLLTKGVVYLVGLSYIISNVSKIKEKISKSLRVCKEVVHNYRTGALSFKTLTDLCIFKLRIWVAKKLEIGLLISSKGKYELIYYDGDMRYKVVFPKNRKIRQISQVENVLGEDITPEILEMMGPSHNFHGISSSPGLLGWKDGLNVKYRSGEEIFYGYNDIIKLYP